ncbi:hypothetical protein [Streptomyces flaveolus]|uniref:hypothetical protein n=1 Tax=Streptomyces flaveolus TaxID=67297 RepID=UPI0034370AC5
MVELIDLSGELFDALGEHAQRHMGGLGYRVPVFPAIWRAEGRAGAEQLGIAQAGQPFPQGGLGDDQDGLELVDRLGAGLDRGVLGELVDPGVGDDPRGAGGAAQREGDQGKQGERGEDGADQGRSGQAERGVQGLARDEGTCGDAGVVAGGGQR